MTGPVQAILESKLAQLDPQTLQVENVSHQHSGHAGSPGTGESHFNVKVVSSKFSGLSRVARHKLVYSLLKEELAGPVHALALETHSPEEVKA
jgi:BolA family transcriptional regulator, general stress-responsive regulator